MKEGVVSVTETLATETGTASTGSEGSGRRRKYG